MLEDEVNGNVIPNLPSHNMITVPSSSPPLSNPPGTPPRNSGSSTSSFPSPEPKKKPPDFENKKLNRGISRATDNVNLVSLARSEILIFENCDQEYCIETPIYTFALPDLNSFPEDFKNFLVKDLIAVSTQISLEQANRLNWWTSYCQRLWPLSTSGDGNCLLHAASLGMWGFHDRLLTLRKTLHGYLTQSPRREAIWRRWRRQQDLLNSQAGLVYSEVEWRQEWNAIVNMASTEPRIRRLSVQSETGNDSLSGNIYESLEEIHVLALAHVLKRPIIVIADTVLKDMNGEALAPISFGGIYLPLECPKEECHRSPLLLAFDGGHFSALVSMDSRNTGLSSAVPLMDIAGHLLPIQFSVDPGNNGNVSESLDLSYAQNVDLLTDYLDVIRIDTNNTPPTEEPKNGLLESIGKLKLKLSRSNSQRQSKNEVLCAALHAERHEYHEVMIRNYLETARQRFELQQENNQVNYGLPVGKKMQDGFLGLTSLSTGILLQGKYPHRAITYFNEDFKYIPLKESLDILDNELLLCPQGDLNGGRYAAGKSQFYAAADSESHERVSRLTPVRPAPDPTLYLSKSTFYENGTSTRCQGTDCPFFGNPDTLHYCSKCYQQLKAGI